MNPAAQQALPAPIDPAPLSQASVRREWRLQALADLRDGFRQWPLWYTIGWMDVKQRYRRSLIGPFWITLSLGIFVTGLGIVYGALFNQDLRTYLPYLATGVIVWTMIASLITDGCNTFTNAEGAIKQLPVPISVHVYRMVWRNLIVFGHNLLIFVLLVVIFGIPLRAATLLAIPGLVLVALTGVGIGLVLGVLSARFRDIPLIITNLVQLVFFTTPILWRVDTLPPERAWIAQLNPFHYLIEVVRQPLLGQVLPVAAWLVTGAIAAAALGIGVLFYARYRVRIAYWL
jgi:ABC-2 type transport system permease protein/lipopolysaccharide transport system permease protein